MQMWLAGATTLVFVALAAVPVRAARRAIHLRTGTRWLLGVVLVLSVWLCWTTTWAPAQVQSGGGEATCVEEPLVGLAVSDLSSRACAEANLRSVALSLAGAATVAVAGNLAIRALARRAEARSNHQG